jgi:hypothetical protein
MHVSFFSHCFLPIIEFKPGKNQKITPHRRWSFTIYRLSFVHILYIFFNTCVSIFFFFLEKINLNFLWWGVIFWFLPGLNSIIGRKQWEKKETCIWRNTSVKTQKPWNSPLCTAVSFFLLWNNIHLNIAWLFRIASFCQVARTEFE